MKELWKYIAARLICYGRGCSECKNLLFRAGIIGDAIGCPERECPTGEFSKRRDQFETFVLEVNSRLNGHENVNNISEEEFYDIVKECLE